MRISRMQAEDIEFAVSLTDIEDWGNIAADFERLIYFEPNGCFVARVENRRVGMISTTTYGDYAFLGSLIVDSNFRRRGIGEALMRHAMAYLQGQGVGTMELDGTFQGVPLYRKLGFRDKYLSLRLLRPADDEQAANGKINEYSIDDIVAFDRLLTGLDRGRMLSRFIEEFPDSVYVSGEPSLVGYGIVTPRCGRGRNIGPVVAKSPDIAKRIIGEIIENNRTYELVLGLPGTVTPELISFLTRNGFEYWAPSLRMYYGQSLDYERGMYAILSAAKG